MGDLFPRSGLQPTALGARGFTDRSGLDPLTRSSGSPHDRLTIFGRRVAQNRSAICICERGTGITKWLPLSQIKVESGGMTDHADLADLGEVLRITLPRWLAESRGLAAGASAEGQKSLF